MSHEGGRDLNGKIVNVVIILGIIKHLQTVLSL
jgi:hypothetical protein